MIVSNVSNVAGAVRSSGSGETAAVVAVVILILIGGLVGGYAAYLAEDRKAIAVVGETAPGKLRFLVLGLVASACVPLFLSLVRSDILGEIFTNGRGERLESYLVFVGLCLIAAFSARAFITSISQRILQQVEQAGAQAEQATRKAEEAQATALEVADEQSAEASGEAHVPESGQMFEDLPALDQSQRRVLEALTKMTFRTATGVAADVGISRSQIGELLDSLAAKGLVAIAQSPTTKGVRWKITSKGIASLQA
jgi:ABC-type multidrug transport system fused ATPase/permease subunit